MSFKAHLLPFLDQTSIFDQINFGLNPLEGGVGTTVANDGDANRTARSTKITGFLCPSDPNPGNMDADKRASNYSPNGGQQRHFRNWTNNGIIYTPGWDAAISREVSPHSVIDGLSKTM